MLYGISGEHAELIDSCLGLAEIKDILAKHSDDQDLQNRWYQILRTFPLIKEGVLSEDDKVYLESIKEDYPTGFQTVINNLTQSKYVCEPLVYGVPAGYKSKVTDSIKVFADFLSVEKRPDRIEHLRNLLKCLQDIKGGRLEASGYEWLRQNAAIFRNIYHPFYLVICQLRPSQDSCRSISVSPLRRVLAFKAHLQESAASTSPPADERPTVCQEIINGGEKVRKMRQ